MEKLAFRDELNHYKETIDIRDYLEKTGYSLDKSRDTPRYRAYTHQGLGDKVFIPKNNKSGIANFYVNQFDNDDKGTLIDFIMSRENKTLDEARLTLREFQHGYVPDQEKYSVTENDDQDKKKRQQYIVRKIATEYPSGLNDIYLERRLLTADTRHHPAFARKIKLNEISGERWMAFPLENAKGKPTGLAMKRDGKEKILGEKSGVWISHPTMSDQSVDKIIITEHPIDAMSYHQLNAATLDKQNVMYVATAGNPSGKQIEVIQKKIQVMQPKEVVLANDNDQAGQQYNEKYQQKLKDTGSIIKIEKPQFKDWNADVYAGAVYQFRLLDRTVDDPHKIQHEVKQKASSELEGMLQHKNYSGLTEQQKQELPSFYVERKIEGSTVEFSFKEVALINNDQKLAAQLEKAILAREEYELKEKRAVRANSHKREQAYPDADSYVKNQRANSLSSEPNIKHQESTGIGPLDSFMETQRRYNHQIDILQQQIAGNPAYEQMSRKLYYYKNYPHLNDQEVDIYLSIEDKMKANQQGQSQGLGRQKDREIIM